MKRISVPRLCFLSMTVAVLFIACDCAQERAEKPIEAIFERQGVLECRNTSGIHSIEVEDENGTKVAMAPTFGRSELEIRFDWHEGKSYTLVTDTGQRLSVDAPSEKPEVALRIHAPLGQQVREIFLPAPAKDNEVVPLFAEAGETMNLLIEVEKLSGEYPTELTVSLSSAAPAPDGPRLEPSIENKQVSLGFEFDKKIWQSRITVDEQIPSKPAFVEVVLGGQTVRAKLPIIKREMGAQNLTVASWEMPCDAWGLFQAHRLPDQIALPNPVWNKIGTLFNTQTEQISYFEPFVFERLDLENRSDQPLNLLLKSAVVDERTGAVVPYFTAPDFSLGTSVKSVMGYCQIPAASTQKCVLPIYIKPETPAGTYSRQIEIFPMGSDKRLQLLHAPLSVVRSNAVLSVWLVVVILVSFGWLAAVVVFYKRIVTSFGVRLLVLLSLLGSLLFCLRFGGDLVSSVLYALLGPFNCLVGGLLSEVMTYLIVTSVLYLVPRVGAMTLAGIVSYLMRGILFGSFGLTDILFTGSTIAFWEICLLLFGVTRLKNADHYKPRIVPMMLALGLADAMATFTSLTLHSVFFRLFFADWYIVLQVVVTGFLYTLIGVWLGRSLGLSLRKVHL